MVKGVCICIYILYRYICVCVCLSMCTSSVHLFIRNVTFDLKAENIGPACGLERNANREITYSGKAL